VSHIRGSSVLFLHDPIYIITNHSLAISVRLITSLIRTTSDTVIIEPIRGIQGLNLPELWKYRELIVFLAQRDISIRYKQTLLGAAWAIIQPFLSMVVFTIFFGNLAKISSDGAPYYLFSYAALLPWQYFSTALSSSSNSLVGNAAFLSKIYFPRLIIPIAAVLPALVDFVIAFAMLLVMLFIGNLTQASHFALSWNNILNAVQASHMTRLSWNILWVAPLLILAMIAALGASLWLSALNVRYRDIRYVVPFLIQILMFVSPVVYSSHIVPPSLQAIYNLNVMVGVIDGFRWAILGTNSAPGAEILLSALVAVIIFVSGAFYFRATEKTFADVI